MFKKLTVILALLCCFSLKVSAETISNNYFSFTLPDDTNGTYKVDKFDNGIYINEKVSAKADLSGFAFGLKVFRNPDEYATADGYKKIGELTYKNGVIYDMVLVRPTDVKLAEGAEVQKSYDRLYELGNNVEIKGVNGNKYVKDKGIKGEELYSEILKKYKKAFSENWNLKKYKDENLGYAYNDIKKTKPETNLMNEIGYVYYDINKDGIDELIVGRNVNKKSHIYDIFTMVNRKPINVTSGDDEINKRFICNDNFICKDFQKNGTYSLLDETFLNKNSIKLTPKTSYKRDLSEKAKINWAVRYGNSYKWVSISKKEYNKNYKLYTKNYKKFIFTPFSAIK